MAVVTGLVLVESAGRLPPMVTVPVAGRGQQHADGQRERAERAVGVHDAGGGAPALDERAVGGDQAAARVEAERAGAGVEGLVAVVDHEEAVAGDHEVGAAAGGLRRALAEVGGDAGHPGAEADLRGVGAALVGGRERWRPAGAGSGCPGTGSGWT